MKLNRFIGVLAAVLLMATAAFAQTTGNLTGTVTLGGNPLPGVTVTISSPSLQGTRTAISDANGNYNFGNIPPGEYTVRFDMESMQSVTRTVRVGLAVTSRADADMKLSSVAEAITVTASAPAVLETTEIQSNMTQQMINNLPMSRTLTGAVSLAPGVTATGPNGNQVISGAPSFDNLYMVDGAVVNENLRGQPHDLFIEDAIQETTILTGAISAEFGRFTGGVVTAVTKTGSNEFAGTLRGSGQSDAWTARSEGHADTFRRNDDINYTYEGTLGGRIIRDRLWFFLAGRYFEQTLDRTLFNPANSPAVTPTYQFGREQQRVEVKLTGQVTSKHSLTGSILDITDDQVNNAFGTIWEESAIDRGRSTPNSFATLHYNGVITNSFLIEALAARKEFSFEGSGGDALGDFVRGTNAYDLNGRYYGAPTFCGVCSAEERDNQNWTAKGTYYLSTAGTGTHNIVAGYDDWTSTRKSDNHQSASDFTIGNYTSGGVTRIADGSIRVSTNPGETIIIWWPILQSSKGTDLKTQSFFVNDKWDLSSKLSFNLGARYDKNRGKDGSGALVADDSKISPRLGLTFDTFGNGRLRLNASYSQYVAAIADGNVADFASPAGSPSYLYWIYYGPAIQNATSQQFFQTINDWFRSVGFTNNKDFLAGGSTNGIGSRIPEPLESPYVAEWTIGAGMQIGTRGFVRADYIDREWSNFYTTQTNKQTGTVLDPLAGVNKNIGHLITTDDFVRTYKGVQLQASYQPFSRLNIGGNYTNSRLRGNHGAETAGSGPVGNSGPNDFPEILGYAQRNPEGPLPADQEHKGRLWVSYDQPTPFGTINVSLLQRYDAGSPYSAVGVIDPRWCRGCNAANPTALARSAQGYLFPPTTANYFFSERGAFKTDDVTATDLAFNYIAPPLLGKVQFYIESELRNVFNEQAVVNLDTTIVTARTSGSLQPFDPRRDTPVEGTHWRKGPNFGKPSTPTNWGNAGTSGHWQLPRTFLLSAGVKF